MGAAFPGTASDAAGALLKQEYLPGLQSQIATDTFLMDTLKRVPQIMFKGNQVQWSARKGFGFTHTVDAGIGDTLPPRSVQDYDTLTFDVKEIAHRIGFSAIGLERTKNAPEGAFVDILEAEMDGAREGIGQELNRQMMGDASGVLATVTTSGAATVTMIVGSTRFLREGEPVALVNAAAGTDAASPDNTVSSINSGTEITLAATATFATVDALVHRRGSSTPLYDTDMFGLEAIVATTNPGVGNFGNVDRTASGKRYWQAQVLDNAGTNRPLTSRLLKQGLNMMDRRGSRNAGDRIGMTNDAIALEYGVTLAADKRYPAEFVKLDGGWDALSFAGVPIVWDKDAPENTLFYLQMNDLAIAELTPVTVEDRGGGELFRVAGAHQFETLLYTMLNLIARRCNTHVAIKDIREDNATHNL